MRTLKNHKSSYIRFNTKFLLCVLYLLGDSEELEIRFSDELDMYEIIQIITPNWHIYIWAGQYSDVRIICETCYEIFEISFMNRSNFVEALNFFVEHTDCNAQNRSKANSV